MNAAPKDSVKTGKKAVKGKKKLDKSEDQSWFWTKEWQDVEKEAEDDIVNGRVEGPFKTADEVLASLRNEKKPET